MEGRLLFPEGMNALVYLAMLDACQAYLK